MEVKIKIIFRKILFLLWINLVHCSVTGLSYMDPIKNKLPPGEDPCNPLYWYPRSIPEYCNYANTIRPVSSEEPPSVTPMPPALPVLVPMPPVPILPPPLPILPPPQPLPILPAPLPTPMLSISSNIYPYSHINPMSAFSPNSLPYYSLFQRPPIGFVPGIHGVVTKDGGINIMPFSDAYADMLDKHKNKMIRRRLHKILDKYNYDPYSRDSRILRKYEKYFIDD